MLSHVHISTLLTCVCDGVETEGKKQALVFKRGEALGANEADGTGINSADLPR